MKRHLSLVRDELAEIGGGSTAEHAITQNCQSLDFCFTIPIRQCLDK